MSFNPDDNNPKTKARARLKGKEDFIERHPEHAGVIGVLLDTVTSCPESEMGPPNIPLDAARTHIFGKVGDVGCRRCQKNYEAAKQLTKSVYNREPKPHSGFES